MRRFTMRLLPLALACLLAAQAVSAGRALHATQPKAGKKPAAAVPTWRKQYVQFVVSIQGKTCAELPQGPEKFNQAYRAAMKADVAAYITTFAPIGGYDPAAVIATIGTPGTNCTDWSDDKGVNYAGVRAAASFNGTNNTLIRDFLWDSTREGICSGKYRQDVWVNVAALMNTNSLTVRLNNGSRQNPFGANMGWVPIPKLPCGPTPKPSPSPAEPSPSPEPPVPSPSPAPGCAAIPNSETQADGSCKCTKPGFTIDGTDNGKLVYCVSSSATVCPDPVSTAVKDGSTPVPKLVACITPTSDCPVTYPFPLYGGSPSTKKECRLKVVDCTYTPFTMKITDVNGLLIGCVNPASNACPFVAFRSAPSFALDFCRQVDACPVYSGGPVQSTVYTVSGRAADRSLTACLTLANNNVCPTNVPTANYPVEVVLGNPTGCGATAQTCTYNGLTESRVVECLATGAACDPARFPLQIFKFVGAGDTRPVLVGCREARPYPGVCNLTPNGMGTIINDPNADSYDIPVYQTQANLVGCVVQNSKSCPVDYPIARRNDAGAIQSCAPATDARNPCIGNSAEPVPLMNADGTWMGVCVARTSSCSAGGANPSYGVQYGTPVTIRNAIGEMIQCRKQIATCPTTAVLDTDGTSTVFSTFPMYASTGLIASCYPPAAVGSTCTISIDGNQYTTKISSNATGTPTLKGCLATPSFQCPADFPFTVLNDVGQVVSCAPAGELTSCPVNYIPATTSGALVGCLPSTITSCPATLYPTTIATAINGQPLECMTANSVCYKTTQPFSLFETVGPVGAQYLELTWCINPQESITNCDQASPAKVVGPVGASWQHAAEVYNTVGSSILGCVRRPDPNVLNSLTSCPVEFPFIFKDDDGATFQCRESIAPSTTCAEAVNGATAPTGIGLYNVDVRDVSRNLVGCTTTGGEVCQGGGVIVSQTAFTVSELCLSGNVTSCAGVTNAVGTPRTFPIYSGENADGSARLVRCIAPVVGTDCTSSAVTVAGGPNYNVPVYANADGTGQVIGCVRHTGEQITPCPASAPFYLLDYGPDSWLYACIQSRPACNITTTAWSGYTVPLTTSKYTTASGTVLGCSNAVNAGQRCPETPYFVPFVIRKADGTISRCEQQALNAVTSCVGFSPAGMAPIIDSPTPGATAPVIGCQIPATTAGNGVFPNRCSLDMVAIYGEPPTNALLGCSSQITACGGRYEVPAWANDDGTGLQSCHDFDGAARRRNLLASNLNITGCAEGYLAYWNGNTLKECRQKNAVYTACTGNLLNNATDYTINLYKDASNDTTLEGCTNAANTCPTYNNPTTSTEVAWPFPVWATATALGACSKVAPTSCPVGTVPVYNNVDGSTANATELLSCAAECPTGYTFFRTDDTGSKVACYLSGANVCSGNYTILMDSASAAVACFPRASGATDCPATPVAGTLYLTSYFYATSATDATPVLGRCYEGNTWNVSSLCSPPNSAPIFAQTLVTTAPDLAATVIGCVDQAGTDGPARCPTTFAYPVLTYNNNGNIQACFNARGACDGSGLAPLCSASVQNGAPTCPQAYTDGCIVTVPSASSDPDVVNPALAACPAPTRGYPTSTSYNLWAAALTSDTGLTTLKGCFSAPPCATGATAAGTFAASVSVGSTLEGCVDRSIAACTGFATAINPSFTCSGT